MLKEIVVTSFIITTNIFASLSDIDKPVNTSPKASGYQGNLDARPSLPPLFDLENPPTTSAPAPMEFISPFPDTPKVSPKLLIQKDQSQLVPAAAAVRPATQIPPVTENKRKSPSVNSESSDNSKLYDTLPVRAAAAAAGAACASAQIVCNECKKMCKCLNGLKIHIGKTHSKLSPRAKEALLEAVNAQSDLPQAKRRKLNTAPQTESKQSKEEQIDDTFICPHCQLACRKKTGLVSHMRFKHPAASQDLAQSKEDDDNDFVEKPHPKKRAPKTRWFYECLVCLEKFPDTNSLEAHEKSHDAPKAQVAPNEPKKCTECADLKKESDLLKKELAKFKLALKAFVE